MRSPLIWPESHWMMSRQGLALKSSLTNNGLKGSRNKYMYIPTLKMFAKTYGGGIYMQLVLTKYVGGHVHIFCM